MSTYEENVCEAIKTSSNFKEVANKLDVGVGGSTYKEFYRISKKYNISLEHFGKIKKVTNNKRHLTFDEIFTENSNISSSRLNRYIKKFHLKNCICEKCKNVEWLGAPIPLQVHHINGNTTDNRLENLQYLCPNCHSQTDNFCGKNTNKTKNNNKRIEENKIKKEKSIKDKIELIHSSNVDFSKWGWVSKVAKICGTTTSHLKTFMETYDYEFYITCYNREKAKLKASEEKTSIENSKRNKLNRIEDRKQQIIDTGITSKDYGWQTKLSSILSITRQSLKGFIDKHMIEFYDF